MRKLLALLLLLGCSKRPETLSVYTSLDAQEAPVYIDAFTKDTGIRVNWVRLSAGEALARLEAEKQNPQVSAWFGGPSPEYIVAEQRGLIEPWDSFYVGVIGFACYEPFFQERKLNCPTSWDELLAPALRGQISLAYPYTSGTAYITLASLLQQRGEQQGWEFVRRLDAQVHHYNSSGSAAVTQAGLGEVAVGIAFVHDILKKGKSRGYPIALGIPREGTASEVGAVAVVKGGPQPELGKRFAQWLVSERAQNLLAEFYRVPVHANARVAEGAVRRSDVQVIPLDVQHAAEQQKEILAQWRRVTGR